MNRKENIKIASKTFFGIDPMGNRPYWSVCHMRYISLLWKAMKEDRNMNPSREQKESLLEQAGNYTIDRYEGFRDYMDKVIGNTLGLLDSREAKEEILNGCINADLLLLSFYINRRDRKDFSRMAIPTYLTTDSQIREKGYESCFDFVDDSKDKLVAERLIDPSAMHYDKESDSLEYRRLFGQIQAQGISIKAIPTEILDVIASERTSLMNLFLDAILSDEDVFGYALDKDFYVIPYERVPYVERKPWDDEPVICEMLEGGLLEINSEDPSTLCLTEKLTDKQWGVLRTAQFTRKYFCNLPYIRSATGEKLTEVNFDKWKKRHKK